jgi:tRNA methyltransferase complex GCD14 subunit.
MTSPFLTRNALADTDNLALLQLRRDQIVPTILRDHDDENQGYWEGKVTNTRFGSFPHSTLIGQPWGTQVVASKVDTGSRGRNKSAKRKAEELDAEATTTGAEEEKKKPSLRTPSLRKADSYTSSPRPPKRGPYLFRTARRSSTPQTTATSSTDSAHDRGVQSSKPEPVAGRSRTPLLAPSSTGIPGQKKRPNGDD